MFTKLLVYSSYILNRREDWKLPAKGKHQGYRENDLQLETRNNEILTREDLKSWRDSMFQRFKLNRDDIARMEHDRDNMRRLIYQETHKNGFPLFGEQSLENALDNADKLGDILGVSLSALSPSFSALRVCESSTPDSEISHGSVNEKMDALQIYWSHFTWSERLLIGSVFLGSVLGLSYAFLKSIQDSNDS